MKQKKPNFLVIMADFMGALTLPMYGNPIARTPNLERLGDEAVVFENAYCNYPLCVPSRASMMSSQLPSDIGVYDNGAEFPASIPTFAHYLRQLGYRCELAGKMHFIGPDQLHGFDQRLTTDMVPADFGWMPPWGEISDDEWPSLHPIREAGVVSRTMGIDFDEEVAYRASRRLFDFARDPEQQPFLLTVSFIEPHEPFKTTQQWWDQYSDDDVGLPSTPLLAESDWDAHSRRLYELMRIDADALTDEQIRRARHGFYSMLSFVDHKVGEVLNSLRAAGLDENTIVIVTADHGTMLGERGLWGILNFFDWAMRVPLLVHAPGRFAARRVSDNVSLLDLMPTLLDMATDGKPPTLATEAEGISLLPHASGDSTQDDRPIFGEVSAEGCIAPCVMVKQENFKYVHCRTDPPMLFDHASDPAELVNLAQDPAHRTRCDQFESLVQSRWDLERWERELEVSRQRRIAIFETYAQGNPPVWEYAVNNDPWQSYQRSFSVSWQDAEHKATLK